MPRQLHACRNTALDSGKPNTPRPWPFSLTNAKRKFVFPLVFVTALDSRAQAHVMIGKRVKQGRRESELIEIPKRCRETICVTVDIFLQVPCCCDDSHNRMHGDTSWGCHCHNKGQADHDTALQKKVCGAVRCAFFVDTLTAKAAPHTGSDSGTVQARSRRRHLFNEWMPECSL